jgi:hypothetical protein
MVMESDAANYEQTVAAAYSGARSCVILQRDLSSPFLGTIEPGLLAVA